MSSISRRICVQAIRNARYITSSTSNTTNLSSSSFNPLFNPFPSPFIKPPSPPSTLTSALELLKSQNNHFIVADIKGRSYLLAKNDVLTVPRLNDVNVGDVLSLSHIRQIGSRDYTLRGLPFINLTKAGISVSATVIEHKKAKMIDIVKFKRRKNYQRLLHHKQTHTVLRIGDIKLDNPVETSS